MSGRIVCTVRADGPPLDLEGVTPERCAALPEHEVAALPITAGGRAASLGDFFAVRGGHSDQLVFEGSLARVCRLGAGMAGGRIDVHGDVGDEAGMTMRGGVLRIDGNAGDRLGAGVPGAARGMSGGEILVSGACGVAAGARLRRGLIVVGRCGADAARDIVAGTLVVIGPAGAGAGRGSRRGSVIAVGHIDVPPTYQYACTYAPPFVRLLFTYLRRRHALPLDPAWDGGQYRRYCGDLGGPGKGELLVWTGA